jgi:hypothetical protein
MHRNIYLRRIAFSIAICVLLTADTSCFRHYYKIAKGPVEATPARITQLQEDSRYFILRSGPNAYRMKDVSVDSERQLVHCTLDSLPIEHLLHVRGGLRHGNKQYRFAKPERVVLTEVHLYVPTEQMQYGDFTLDLRRVENIEIIQKDNGRTTGSYVLGSVAVVGTIAATALIITVLTSCPFVSAYDGQQFILQGEVYGGAVYPQLSRHDYLRMNMLPTPSGKLQIKISNELKEIQHTDLAELLIVNHKPDVNVYADACGNIFSIAHPVQPVSVTGADAGSLATKDNRVAQFDDPASPTNAIIMQFNKPADAKRGKLVLSIKNTYWLDQLYGKMLEGFGNYYGEFVKQQSGKPAATLNKWTSEQQIPLSVSVKQSAGWKTITELPPAGPLLSRDVVVPVNVSSVDGDVVEVRLSTGFMFWEIDRAAIDYSDEGRLTIAKQKPVVAVDEKGNDVTQRLLQPDDICLDQPSPGNVTTVTFDYQQPPAGEIQTYILHTKGHYETLRNFSGKPDLVFLKQFKQPGALSKFSIDMYRKQRSTAVK